MLFSKTNNSNLLKNSLKVAISDLQSASYESMAYNMLNCINNVLSSYCFFSSFFLRKRINWVKRNIDFTPIPLTSTDISMINMIIAELEVFLNAF